MLQSFFELPTKEAGIYKNFTSWTSIWHFSESAAQPRI